MAYKKQINLCVPFIRTCMKNYLIKLTQKNLTTNKSIWKFIKTFLTNKGFIGNNELTIIYKNKTISDEKQLTKLFNSYYLNIVEKSSGTTPKTFGINFENISVQSVKDIVNSYKNHSSITKIKQVVHGAMFLIVKGFPSKWLMKLKLKAF